MTEKLLNKDFQKQAPGSAILQLFELELSSSSTVYFHAGVEEDLSTVQFRQEDGTINTYVALPVKATGFGLDPSGPVTRPSIAFANALSVFGNAVGEYDDLLGTKITRRTTLQKYLVGESGDATPPVEFVKQVFLIDRIKQTTKEIIEFELAAPFDLQGVTLPARQVVANACPWIYQGAAVDISNEYEKNGGCTWHTESKYKPSFKPQTSGLDGTVEYIALVNIDDEYIVPNTGETGTVTFSTSVGSITKNSYYKTTTTLGTSSGVRRLQKSGAIDTSADSSTVNNYWQARSTTSSPGTLSDSNSNVKRVRVWSTWDSSTTFFAYTSDNFNDYVKHTSGGVTRLWKAKKTSLNQTPDFGIYWELADMCSKTLTGCKMRYGFNPQSVGTSTSTGKCDTDTKVVLPFGGFPGARSFN
jgi:lambda family phage minor tail protein L